MCKIKVLVFRHHICYLYRCLNRSYLKTKIFPMLKKQLRIKFVSLLCMSFFMVNVAVAQKPSVSNTYGGNAATVIKSNDDGNGPGNEFIYFKSDYNVHYAGDQWWSDPQMVIADNYINMKRPLSILPYDLSGYEFALNLFGTHYKLNTSLPETTEGGQVNFMDAGTDTYSFPFNGQKNSWSIDNYGANNSGPSWLRFMRNGSQVMALSASSGYSGVAASANTLYISGALTIDNQIKIKGGNPGEGKILTSDADGLATWKAVSQNLNLVDKYNNVFMPSGTTGAAGRSNTSGSSNIGIGEDALAYNTIGFNNLAFGAGTLANNTSGSSNIGIGNAAGKGITTGSSNIAIGNNATFFNSPTESNRLNIGNLIYGTSLPSIGATAAGAMPTGGNIGIGTATPTERLEVSGSISNRGNGGFTRLVQGGTTQSGYIEFFTQTGTTNTRAGYIGGGDSKNYLAYSTDGATAHRFLGSNVEVAKQIKIEGGSPGAGKVLTSDANGLATWKTVNQGDTYFNFFWGADAGISNTNGSSNVGIGQSALQYNTIGFNNTALGYGALLNNTTGLKNVAIGNNAGKGNTTGSFNIAIGTDAVFNSPTESNQLNIGNIIYGKSLPTGTLTSRGSIGIGNKTPTKLLEIGVDDAAATAPLLQVHGGAIFNNNSNSIPTQVSINTGARPDSFSLVVGGTTFIGNWSTAESTPAIVKASNRKLASLWVQTGIVSENYRTAPVGAWADSVFKNGYQLPSLSEVESFVNKNKHLPGIPSEDEVKENGYSLNELNVDFLEKIENLMLYSIDQDKKITAMQKQLSDIDQLKEEVAALKKELHGK